MQCWIVDRLHEVGVGQQTVTRRQELAVVTNDFVIAEGGMNRLFKADIPNLPFVLVTNTPRFVSKADFVRRFFVDCGVVNRSDRVFVVLQLGLTDVGQLFLRCRTTDEQSTREHQGGPE